MCIQNWWISISYFAILLYDRESPASTPTKQGIWILFDQVGQPSFLSDLHVNMNFGESICYSRCPTAVLQFHYLRLQQFQHVLSLSGRYKKAIAPSKFCIGSLPHPSAWKNSWLQVLWSLRGFKCDEFVPILGKSSWFATKPRVETPQQIEKPARGEEDPLALLGPSDVQQSPTAVELTFGKDNYFTPGRHWCFIVL